MEYARTAKARLATGSVTPGGLATDDATMRHLRTRELCIPGSGTMSGTHPTLDLPASYGRGSRAEENAFVQDTLIVRPVLAALGRRDRHGTTLIEVLTAIWITGVGLLALLDLFPTGAVSMAQAVREDRAANNLSQVAYAVEAYHQRHGRFPSDIPSILSSAGYPADGIKDGYRLVAIRLDPQLVTILNEPIEPGVHGMLTAVLEGKLTAGKPAVAIGLTPTPGAIESRQKMHGRLLEAAVETSASLMGLLSPDEQTLARRSILPYFSQAASQQPFAVLQDHQGKVSLTSVGDRLSNHPDPAIRALLVAYWKRISRELQLDSYGQTWQDLSPVVNPPRSVNPPLFQFAVLAGLTGSYPMDAQLRLALMQRVKEAEGAFVLGLASQKEAALTSYVGLVRQNAGVRIGAGHANALANLAASL